jgi:hypothetical protein
MINFINFDNPGVILDTVPDDIINQLKTHIGMLDKTTVYNNNLAGNIQEEYKFPEAVPIIKDYIFDLAEKYEEKFSYLKRISILTESLPFILKKDDVWINFQRRNEFNPIHDHSGIFSFVIWINVPYYIKDELENSPGKNSNKPVAGHFEFIYNDILGQISCMQLPVDKTFEGKIAFFPSKLSHCVYPFYSSDGIRISISGNIKLDSKK